MAQNSRSKGNESFREGYRHAISWYISLMKAVK